MLIEKVIISVHYPLSTEIKIMKRFLFLICILCGISAAQARDRQCFDKDWRFFLGDSIAMAKADFDDSRWRKLDVPHDWAIEGDFYVSNPSGAGGGALPGGIGWYRKKFTVDSLQFTDDLLASRSFSPTVLEKICTALHPPKPESIFTNERLSVD
jgi:hypothetical protein